MSWTQKSMVLQPYHQANGSLTSRQVSTASQRSRRKGISLSKEHDSRKRNNSPSFIKITQKGKPSVVEKRSIKLILKPRDNEPQELEIGNENCSRTGNIPKREGNQHMDIISANEVVFGNLRQKEFGKFPLKKPVRKERINPAKDWASIQLH